MVELRTVAPAVEGSNPSTHPKFPTLIFGMSAITAFLYCTGLWSALTEVFLADEVNYSLPGTFRIRSPNHDVTLAPPQSQASA